MKLSDFNEKTQQKIREQMQRDDSLRRVEADRPERAALQALERCVPVATGSAARVEVRVHLIAMRRRLLDSHDNLIFSFKPLVDAIAETLGCDDADERLTWEFSQCKTRDVEGVIVKIECLP